MKVLAIAIALLGTSTVALAENKHHELKSRIWCEVGASAEDAVNSLNAKIENNGHLKHHMEVKFVSAPAIVVDSHKHHQTRACATVTYTEVH